MLTFLLLMFMILVFLTIASRAARRSRRIEEERRAAELSQGGGDGDDLGGFSTSPFGMFPFGGLLGQLMSGHEGLSRSYVFDEETGRWVDISELEPGAEDELAESDESPLQGGRDDPSTDQDHAARTAAKRRRRQTARARQNSTMASPFSLFGGGGDGGDFDVQSPEELVTFDDVGGMDHLKREVRDTVGLMLEHPDDAERYGIEWNGLLLHGPPGVGKTFFAQAIAGEYRMNFMHISTGDLVGSLVGQSARNIETAFDKALQNLPCLLFFDEFDSVAQRRDNTPDQESRRTVNQLLTSLEANRDERRLLVMAATNSVEHLDPAVIRPGRFDRRIRIDLPDADARRAVFLAELDDRPVADEIQLDELVPRTEGMTPAAISKIVDTAALEVFREAANTGENLELHTEHLLRAIERYGGQDRPMVEHWTWDSLVLSPAIKAQLQQLQTMIEDPESARRFGIEPPTGLLLAGPPGTGKTSVAKVLAAQARCSFYPISGADVMSKWVGESERNIRQLFERARDNRPSIVFIDEIDAVAGRRGEVEVHDGQVNQLLSEIDGISGQRGVFVVGATNRPDQLDPALLRGGRLSRTIVLGLPDESGRLAILRLYAARMPTVGVRLEELAAETAGLSPADLKALCQEAALAAMTRVGAQASNGRDQEPAPEITHEDFKEALTRLRAGPMAPVSY